MRNLHSECTVQSEIMAWLRVFPQDPTIICKTSTVQRAALGNALALQLIHIHRPVRYVFVPF